MTTRPLLDEAQAIKDLQAKVRELQARIGRTGTLAADTGWQTATKESGWGTGDVNVRKVGSLVVVTFSVVIGTTTSGDVLCTVDSQYRPTVTVAGAGVSNSGGGVPAQITVDTGGDVTVFYPAGPTSVNTVRGNLAWLA